MSFYERISEDRVSITDWEALLIADGFDSGIFNKKHQDCPLCGSVKGFRAGPIGKRGDPFRYVCKGCTSSEYKSGYEFLASFHGLTTPTSVYGYIYKNLIGNTEREARVLAAPRAEHIELTPERVAKSLRTNEFLWSKSMSVTEADPVWLYLTGRIPGLKAIPADIHYTKAQYWEQIEDGQPSKMLGEYDAMILRGYSPCGQLVQLHTTYLTPNGDKAAVTNVKKTRPGNGFSSYAFRIGEPLDGVLGVSEGIETALSASLLHNIPVWPCHSCTVLANFEVPDIYKELVKKVVIFADNDRSKVNGKIRNTGLLAAEKLAAKLRQQGYKVVIMSTGIVGDFNDFYQKKMAEAPFDRMMQTAESKFANFG